MSEKRFTIYKEDKFKDEWYAYPFYIKDNGEKITETMPRNTAKEVANLLNSLSEENEKLTKENDKLKETCNKFEEAIEKRGYEDIDDFW